MFVRKEYRDGYKTEECIPGDDCIHTYTYHTISAALIEFVGEENYAVFKEKYYGSEAFNILHFIEYFSISEKEMTEVLQKDTHILPFYKTEYLFGNEEMQRLYFVIRKEQ